MTARFAAILVAAIVVITHSDASSSPEAAAIEGAESQYRGDGARFVRASHTARINEFREELLSVFGRSVKMPDFETDLKRMYKVDTLEEVRALDPKEFVRRSIDHLYDENPESRKQAIDAKFEVTGVISNDGNKAVVAIRIDSGRIVAGRQIPRRIEVTCRKEGQEWKFWKSDEG